MAPRSEVWEFKAVLALLNSSSRMVDSRKTSQRDKRHSENTWAGMSDTGKKISLLVAEGSGHKTSSEGLGFKV